MTKAQWTKVVNDAIKWAEKEHDLIYCKETRYLRSKVHVIHQRIDLTREFLIDAYAYFDLKPTWLIGRIVRLYKENAEVKEIDIEISSKKGYYDHSTNKLIKTDVKFMGKKSNNRSIVLEKYTIPIQY